MPELPEVEHFRGLLLPLISRTAPLSVELLSEKPPKSFISRQDVSDLNEHCYLVDVKRKGKLLCLILDLPEENSARDRFLFLHMGMTGRITNKQNSLRLMSGTTSSEYPPAHTHMRLRTGCKEVCFSDPRKFGSAVLADTLGEGFGKLAPDALEIDDTSGLVNQALAIKAILLDQSRGMSGVGNWVADEALYHSRIHPSQRCLNQDEADRLLVSIKDLLSRAVSCLAKREQFPKTWLFHVRWNKKAKSSKPVDAGGRSVSFVQVGGRTSAIVPSIQKLRAVSGSSRGSLLKKTDSRNNKKNTHESGVQSVEQSNNVIPNGVGQMRGTHGAASVRRSRRLDKRNDRSSGERQMPL